MAWLTHARAGFFLCALLAPGFPLHSAVKTKDVEYEEHGTPLEGYLAWDDAASKKQPGVIVVHEWNGLGDYVKGRARQLAALGYVAFCADIYGKGVRPKTPAECATEAGKYRADRNLLRARMDAALSQIRSAPGVDADRIAAIGYCFGGTAVLELARSGARIAGVVSFHGGLQNPEPSDAQNIRCKVLVLHGSADTHVPLEDVTAFEKEMNATNVDWQVNLYSGASHGFSNPANGSDASHGVAYNREADERSWRDMRAFFAEIFAAAPE